MMIGSRKPFICICTANAKKSPVESVFQFEAIVPSNFRAALYHRSYVNSISVSMRVRLPPPAPFNFNGLGSPLDPFCYALWESSVIARRASYRTSRPAPYRRRTIFFVQARSPTTRRQKYIPLATRAPPLFLPSQAIPWRPWGMYLSIIVATNSPFTL
jgi:hypothetical protein